jgi:hypothetical protein
MYEISGSCDGENVDVGLWVVTPCGLAGGYNVSEENTASVFRAVQPIIIPASDFSIIHGNSFTAAGIVCSLPWSGIDSHARSIPGELSCGGIIAFRAEIPRERIILLSFTGQSRCCFLAVTNITDDNNAGVRYHVDEANQQTSRHVDYFLCIAINIWGRYIVLGKKLLYWMLHITNSVTPRNRVVL